MITIRQNGINVCYQLKKRGLSILTDEGKENNKNENPKNLNERILCCCCNVLVVGGKKAARTHYAVTANQVSLLNKNNIDENGIEFFRIDANSVICEGCYHLKSATAVSVSTRPSSAISRSWTRPR